MENRSTTLANRLAEILHKLNTGAVLSVKELAAEFSVSERTIQKDLNQRLDPNIIEDLGGGHYRLIKGYLGNLTSNDIKEFSEISGIIDLYPNIDDVLYKKIKNSLMVKSRVNKGCLPRSNDFTEVSSAIDEGFKIKFSYNNKSTLIEPYKLLNHNGIWYLLGVVEGRIKSYCLHKMMWVRKDIKKFNLDRTLLKKIESNPSPWFRLDKTEVILLVKSDFVDYFIDRNILPESYGKNELENGDLKIHLKVNSVDEIKGIIKFWLPNIHVISPESLRDSIKKDLINFLEAN